MNDRPHDWLTIVRGRSARRASISGKQHAKHIERLLTRFHPGADEERQVHHAYDATEALDARPPS
jgi:hypothetical protein